MAPISEGEVDEVGLLPQTFRSLPPVFVVQVKQRGTHLHTWNETSVDLVAVAQYGASKQLTIRRFDGPAIGAIALHCTDVVRSTL